MRLDPALVVDVPHLARGTRLYDGCMNRTVLIRLRRICGRIKTTKRLVIQWQVPAAHQRQHGKLAQARRRRVSAFM